MGGQTFFARNVTNRGRNFKTKLPDLIGQKICRDGFALNGQSCACETLASKVLGANTLLTRAACPADRPGQLATISQGRIRLCRGCPFCNYRNEIQFIGSEIGPCYTNFYSALRLH